MNAETITPAIRHAGHQMTEAEARAKMDAYIESCKTRAVRTMEQIRDVVPTDRIIPATALTFSHDEQRLQYIAPAGPGKAPVTENLHRNALQQLAGRLNVPMAYVDHLAGLRAPGEGPDAKPDAWGLRLLSRSLAELAEHSGDRYLVRSVGGEARAFLSDKFRRIDCRPGALALLEAAMKRGMIVSDGAFTDTRSSMKFIRPEVLEVFPGEYMVFGFEWSNSDYGRGASDLRLFFWRCLCWNGATGESVVRQIHIGRRLQDDVEYAQETLEADAKASALALRDAAASAMSPEKTAKMIEGIKAANATKIDPKGRVESLRKVMTKGEAERVVEAFNSPDVENMPAGNTLWRWSNAISWVGGKLDDDDRRLDFERYAGAVLGRGAELAPPQAA